MMRLDKLLAHSQYGTRKEVKELIRKGYVEVNGNVIRNDDFKNNVMICSSLSFSFFSFSLWFSSLSGTSLFILCANTKSDSINALNSSL